MDVDACGSVDEPGHFEEARTAERRAGFRWVAPLIAAVPILEIYASPVAKISWAGVSLFVMTTLGGIHLLSLKRSERPAVRSAPLVFVVLLFAISALASIIPNEVVLDLPASVMRMALLSLWAVAACVAGAALCRPLQIARWVQRIAFVATIFVMVQWVAWHVLGFFIPSVLDTEFLSPISNGYADIGALETYYRTFYFRPASFFAEPQYFSDYACLALILTLFGPAIRRRYAFALFLSVGIVVSTSTTGLILGSLIWVWFLFRPPGGLRAKSSAGGLLLLALPLLALAYAGGLLRNFLKIDFTKLATVQSSGRVGGSFDLLGQLHGTQQLFGVGIGNERSIIGNDKFYYNSVTAIGLGAGIIGLLAALGLIVHLLSQSHGATRLMLTAYALLSMSGSMLYSNESVLWLWLALYGATLWPKGDSNGSEPDRTDDSVRRQDIPHHGRNRVVRNNRDEGTESHRLRRNSDLLAR